MSRIGSAALPAETIELLKVLGFLHLQNGNPREATALLEACDHAGGCHGKTLILLALAQLRAGTPEKALSTLARADGGTLALSSHGIVRAQALAAAGRRDEARQAMTAHAATHAATNP